MQLHRMLTVCLQINSLQNTYIEYKSKNQLYGNSAFFLVKRYPATDKISIGSLSQWKEFISIGDTENVSFSKEFWFQFC
jgi:hypothetical protein